MSYLLAIDQGSTNSRAALFNYGGTLVDQYEIELTQYFPKPGYVEHDAEEIWQNTLDCCQKVIAKQDISAKAISAIGISNQRETIIFWDRTTGKPLHKAIVWQDRRTTQYCKKLAEEPSTAESIHAKTGLIIDPYFSASKIKWLLENLPQAQQLADQGKLLCGTVDSFLIWQLTAGKHHVTDITNASRTMLYNIHDQQWDDELLSLFKIPRAILPQVMDSCDHFGHTSKTLFGHEIPITGVAGDQQAALIGQACFRPGMVKSTYGTGCFMLVNTGEKAVSSKNRLITTVAYRINQKTCYALEGSIFIAGAAIQWLRDTIKLISNASQSESIATSVPDSGDVYVVPAFTGLGAPYWDPNARGAILGLTRNSSIAHIVRATLESVCYQTRDLMEAMLLDGAQFSSLRVDGGMVQNSWLMQFLADLLNVPIDQAQCLETTAKGAAYLAGLGQGIYTSFAELEQLWQSSHHYSPQMEDTLRNSLYKGWQQAVNRVIT